MTSGSFDGYYRKVFKNDKIPQIGIGLNILNSFGAITTQGKQIKMFFVFLNVCEQNILIWILVQDNVMKIINENINNLRISEPVVIT